MVVFISILSSTFQMSSTLLTERHLRKEILASLELGMKVFQCELCGERRMAVHDGLSMRLRMDYQPRRRIQNWSSSALRVASSQLALLKEHAYHVLGISNHYIRSCTCDLTEHRQV